MHQTSSQDAEIEFGVAADHSVVDVFCVDQRRHDGVFSREPLLHMIKN